jgi:hypothetical protein
VSRIRRLAALATALWLAGCAGGSGTGTADGWVDRMVGSPAAQGQPRPAYAAAARTKVYSAPDASASVVGVLTLHEAISRYQHENGFAYVQAEGNLSGWVRENELAETRPPARKPAERQRAKPQPAPTPETTVTETPIEEAPPVEEEPVLDEEAPEPERSVFDPY